MFSLLDKILLHLDICISKLMYANHVKVFEHKNFRSRASILGSGGDYLSIALGFGLALIIGILAFGVSGGHLNPAVTLSLAVVKKCNWIQFPIYVIAQCLGAFLGAVTLYINNYKSIE